MPIETPTWEDTLDDVPSWDDTEELRTPEREAQWQAYEQEKIAERERGQGAEIMAKGFGAGEAMLDFLANVPRQLYNTPANLVNLVAGRPVMKTLAPGEAALPEMLPSADVMAKYLKAHQNPLINIPDWVAPGVAGTLKGTEDLIRGLSTPEVLMTLPAGGAGGVIARAPAAAFASQMALHTPEAYSEFGRATVEESLPEAVRKGVGAGGSSLMITHISAPRGGRYALPTESSQLLRGVRARNEAQQAGAEVPTEESRAALSERGREAGMAEEAQVLLNQHIGDRAYVFDESLPEDVALRADMQQGRIVVNPAGFSRWVEQDLKHLSPADKAEAVRSAIEHEDIHLKTPAEDAVPFWQSLSGFEQFVLQRQYLKGTKVAEGIQEIFNALRKNPLLREAKAAELQQTATEIFQRNMGLEAIRNRVERAARLTRNDFLGLVGKEKWTAKSLDALANVVSNIRRLHPDISKTQDAILTKVLDNIDAARKVVVAQQPTEPGDLTDEDIENIQEYEKQVGTTVEQARNNPPKKAETPARDYTAELQSQIRALESDPELLSDADKQAHLDEMKKELAREQKRKGGRRTESIGPAMRRRRREEMEKGAPPEDNYELREFIGEKFSEINDNFLSGLNATPQVKWLSNYIDTRIAELEKARQMPEYAGISGEVGREITELNQWRHRVDALRAHNLSTEQLKDIIPGIEAAGGEPGPGLGPAMRRRVTIRRADGSEYEAEFNGYYDLREMGRGFVPSLGRDTEQGLSHGMLNKGETIVSPVPSPEEAMGPAMRRRTRGEDAARLHAMRVAAATGGEFEPAVEASAKALAFQPITPTAAGEAALDYFGKADRPNYENFSGVMRGRFGPIGEEAMRQEFKQAAMRYLTQAPGAALQKLIRTMNLSGRFRGRLTMPGQIVPGNINVADPIGSDVPQLDLALFRDFEAAKTPGSKGKALQRAVKRAQTAVQKEYDYRLASGRAAQLRQELRDVGVSDVTSRGEPLDMERRRIKQLTPEQAKADVREMSLELMRTREFMDQSLDPGLEARQKKVAEGEKKVMLSPKEREEALQALVLNPAFQPTPPPKTKVFTKPQQRRFNVIANIFDELVKESEQTKKSTTRTEVTIDDLGSQKKATEPVYSPVQASELRDPQALGERLTKDARTSGQKVSLTHRLVALVSKESGRVELVDIYDDRHRGGAVVMSPTGQGGHQTLESAMKTHRPIYSIYLDEPVQNFRQRFKSVREYEEQFGKRASEIANEPEPLTTEDIKPGVMGELGKAVSRPVNEGDAAALVDFLNEEVGGGMNEPFDLATAVDSLKRMADINRESRLPSPKERARRLAASRLQEFFPRSRWGAIAALEKMFRAVEKAHKEFSDGEILELIGKELYDAQRTTRDYEGFLKSVVGRFGGKPETPVRTAERASPTSRELTAPSYRTPIEAAGGPPLQGVTGRAAETARAEAEARSAERTAAVTKEALAAPAEETAGSRAMRETMRAQRQGQYEAETEGEFMHYTEGPAMRRRRANVVSRAIMDFGSAYDEWMVDRIGRVGGEASKEHSRTLRGIVDQEKKNYGTLTPVLDPARRAAGEMGRATTWLHNFKKVTPFTGKSNTVGAIEGTMTVPLYARGLVNLARQANLAIGRMLQSVIPGFIATGKFQRNLNAYGYDLVRLGRGPEWMKWTAGVARANKVPISEVRTFFRDWKEILDTPGVDAPMIEKVNQDFARKFPEVITHIKTRTGWEEVMHSNLFNYLENAARRATHVKAFRDVFPNNRVGRHRFASMMDDLRRELGPEHQKDAEALMRVLQGQPTDNYAAWGMMGPTRPVGSMFRMANQTVGNLMARMVLTGQMFIQPSENVFGGTAQKLGYKNWARGLAKAGQLYAQLEQEGAVNRVMRDFSWDSNSPIRSLFKIAGNTVSKWAGEQMLNELQEAHAAATAAVVVDRIQTGSLSEWEQRMLPRTFKAMDFSPAEISLMMRGNPELLDQFQRKAASFLTSGNKAVAEGSRLSANRLFNSVFRFQTYPMMKVNQTRKALAGLAEAFESGTPTERWSAAEEVARNVFGNLAQGALTAVITTVFYQGLFGNKIQQHEVEDSPMKFLAESYLASLGGPLYMVWRGARSNGVSGVGEQATRMVFPYAIARDLMDMAQGAGQYRDMDTFDKIGKFIANKTPGTRALATGMAFVGLSQENRELDASISALNRWKLENYGLEVGERKGPEREGSEFRTAMRKVLEALKNGDKKAYYEAIGRAAGVAKGASSQEKWENIASSLRGRRKLTIDGKPMDADQLGLLREHIGPEAVQRLQNYDGMLEVVAESGNFVPVSR